MKDRLAHLADEVYSQSLCYVKEHTNGHRHWVPEQRVTRRLGLPRLPLRPGGTEIWAVTLVKDEIDIIGFTLTHLLGQGVDHIIVADHLSTDGTREFLGKLATTDTRIHVALDSEPGHHQMEKVSRLSRAAWAAGARWVIPFDADEFWFARGESVASFLHSRSESVVRAATVNMVPTGSTLSTSATAMADPSGTSASKVAFRSHPLALVGPGNHGVARVGNHTDGLYIAHLPYRGIDQIGRKYRNGASALDSAGAPEYEGWHWRSGARMTESQIDQAWERMRSGRAIPEIGWPGVDTSIRVRPLEWDTWDPDNVLP